jgi:polyisoprenoid-binding protein YceI
MYRSCLVALLLFQVPQLLFPASWKVAPQAGARVELIVEKTGLMSGKKHVFQFSRYSGDLSYVAAKPEATTMVLNLEAAGLVCEDTWVNAKDLKKITDLAQQDILQSSKHPQVRFQLLSLKPLGTNQAEASGQVTMRGITKAVAFPVTYSESANGLSIKGTAKIKLTDFQIKPPTAALGAVGTKDEMTLNFQLTATR